VHLAVVRERVQMVLGVLTLEFTETVGTGGSGGGHGVELEEWGQAETPSETEVEATESPFRGYAGRMRAWLKYHRVSV
jgi:hypothetical protein